jgi:hypothetical protein
MFVAILERKDHGSNVKYKATLRIAAETKGTNREKWRWSDFLHPTKGSAQKYETTNRAFTTENSACKSLLNAFPRATIGIE